MFIFDDPTTAGHGGGGVRILVVGAGGREHALVWKLAQGHLVEKIFVAPGNAGMADVAECLPIAADKTVELANFAGASRIDFTVVGPESPLVAGIVDYFLERKLLILGPTRSAARLEGSKAFAKKMMERCGVPTARYQVFQELEQAEAFLAKSNLPVVVKADGLAGGKGVIVAQTREEALSAADNILAHKIFGDAGIQVVIEEYLEGPEVSVLAIVDGTHLLLLEPSQDHKRIFDGDQGPNTGGMGAYSPVPMVGQPLMEKIRKTIFEPIVRGMANEGTPFTGVLYAGLMLTRDGPKVLEFNVRFGDPECQALLPRLKADLVELIMASLQGKLNQVSLQWDPRAAACVVLASQGYPGKIDIGRTITGLNKVSDLPDTVVFHAGTKKEGGRFITAGGRVLNVVGLGATFEAALEKAYQAVDLIQFEGKQFRRDIGAQALRSKTVNERMRR